mmetsp:Transcript_7864/g.11227  ORF Transcript_7864/g.11227 Transcript_7864/m.11227 type:complete len:255 (-) Transcript_7864:66-830(-)
MENKRLHILANSIKGLFKFKLPSMDDISSSVELLNVKAQIDSDVSPLGQTQINQLASKLSLESFIEKKSVQVVAHSPLKRARQTSAGMLNSVAPESPPNNSKKTCPFQEGKIAQGINRVVELDCLKERTPIEWLPVNHDLFSSRIAEFEKWISEQPEDVIAVVGHSQYFKSMLELDFKFGNCDVWEAQFDYSIGGNVEINKCDMNTTEKKSDSSSKEPLDSEKKTVTNGITTFESELKLPRGWKKLKNLHTYEA